MIQDIKKPEFKQSELRLFLIVPLNRPLYSSSVQNSFKNKLATVHSIDIAFEGIEITRPFLFR